MWNCAGWDERSDERGAATDGKSQMADGRFDSPRDNAVGIQQIRRTVVSAPYLCAEGAALM